MEVTKKTNQHAREELMGMGREINELEGNVQSLQRIANFIKVTKAPSIKDNKRPKISITNE